MLLIGSGAAALVLAAIAALWVVHLDQVVTREFQGRHWSVPARVYATPLELYAGAPIPANDLEEQLRLLHYRRGDPSKGAGFYRRSGNAFDVHARRARFIDELREPELVSIHADSSSITSMRHGDGSDLPVFRLDPAVIGSVFPVHGEDRLVIAPRRCSAAAAARHQVDRRTRIDQLDACRSSAGTRGANHQPVLAMHGKDAADHRRIEAEHGEVAAVAVPHAGDRGAVRMDGHELRFAQLVDEACAARVHVEGIAGPSIRAAPCAGSRAGSAIGAAAPRGRRPGSVRPRTARAARRTRARARTSAGPETRV